MLKVKLGDILNSIPALILLSKEKLPIKASYYVARISKKCNEEVKTYNETRMPFITEHGTPFLNEKGEPINDGIVEFRDQEKGKEFLKIETDLLSAEIIIDVEPLSLDTLGNIVIEPSTLLPLHWMLVEEIKKVEGA